MTTILIQYLFSYDLWIYDGIMIIFFNIIFS